MNKKMNKTLNNDNQIYFDKVDFELESNVLENEKIIIDFDI